MDLIGIVILLVVLALIWFVGTALGLPTVVLVVLLLVVLLLALAPHRGRVL